MENFACSSYLYYMSAAVAAIRTQQEQLNGSKGRNESWRINIIIIRLNKKNTERWGGKDQELEYDVGLGALFGGQCLFIVRIL